MATKNMTRTERAAQFVQSATARYGARYDYASVPETYTNQKAEVPIVCGAHGVTFWQKPQDHLQGTGCLSCRTRRGSTVRGRAEAFVRKAQAVHGTAYEYDSDTFEDAHADVSIRCLIPGHGWFRQRATNHLQGEGCPSCGESSRRLTWKSNRLERA